MFDLTQPILRTDISGMPLEWIDVKRAVSLVALGQVAYTCGDYALTVYGGVNRISRRRSKLEINSILSTYGNCQKFAKMEMSYSPPVHNVPLFQRDAHICLYCAERFDAVDLSRDHVDTVQSGRSGYLE